MKRLLLLLLLVFCLTGLPVQAIEAGLKEELTRAQALKRAGQVEEAIALYESLLQKDRVILAYPSGGLMEELLQRAARAAEAGGAEAAYRYAHLLDLHGETGKALVWFRRLLGEAGGEWQVRALERLLQLEREKETYNRYLQEYLQSVRQEAEAERQRWLTQREAEEREEERRLAARAEEEKKAAVQRETAAMEQAIAAERRNVAELYTEMLNCKRDWKGQGNVRTWRLNPGEIPGDYNNSFRRRYRQAQARYEEAAARLADMEAAFSARQRVLNRR